MQEVWTTILDLLLDHHHRESDCCQILMVDCHLASSTSYWNVMDLHSDWSVCLHVSVVFTQSPEHNPCAVFDEDEKGRKVDEIRMIKNVFKSGVCFKFCSLYFTS